MGVFVGGGGGGVDLDLDFKNFWDGVYNFFFCPPLGFIVCFISSFSVKCEMAINTYFNSTAICHDRKISLLNRDYSLI